MNSLKHNISTCPSKQNCKNRMIVENWIKFQNLIETVCSILVLGNHFLYKVGITNNEFLNIY